GACAAGVLPGSLGSRGGRATGKAAEDAGGQQTAAGDEAGLAQEIGAAVTGDGFGRLGDSAVAIYHLECEVVLMHDASPSVGKRIRQPWDAAQTVRAVRCDV